MIPFADYAIVFLRRQYPPINSRRELLQFMGGDATANVIWTDYINWHCDLVRPLQRAPMTFRAWLKRLERDDCTYPEWCLVADVKRDTAFPSARFDKMTEYLTRIGADDSTLDSLESLWIKYNFIT